MKKNLVLAGDVGGTKTRLALVDSASAYHVVALAEFASRDFRSFGDVIAAFQKVHPHQPARIGIGAAGPVLGERIDVTNLPWAVAADDLRGRGYKSPVLANDMVAYGAGIELLQPDGLETLNAGTPRAGNRAVIAAGTGLGECFIVPDADGRWNVFGSEGGHTDFSPTSEIEIELLSFLLRRHKRVSWERVLSGKFGFTNIASFLSATGRYPEDSLSIAPSTTNQSDLGPIVSDHAARGDALATDTLRLFARLYGSEAGNLALKYLALNGIFLGGGIAKKILPWLKQPEFLQAFGAKGRFADLVAAVPVHVIIDPNCAIKGAALLASRSKGAD